MKAIKIKRIYDAPSKGDGYRILVDRIWPRGVSKDAAKLDHWNKNIAPSNQLRQWFNHDPDKFNMFAEKYRRELDSKIEDLDEIHQKAKQQIVTLLYGAKDIKHNQVIVLQNILNEYQ